MVIRFWLRSTKDRAASLINKNNDTRVLNFFLAASDTDSKLNLILKNTND
jgi:hypothetical protein